VEQLPKTLQVALEALIVYSSLNPLHIIPLRKLTFEGVMKGRQDGVE